jgi:hypothetical protein
VSPRESKPVPHAFDPAASGEARREHVIRLESAPVLVPYLALLREHFAPSGRTDARSEASGPFELQRVGLPGGRTALLVSRQRDADPIVLVVDRDAVAWTRRRPVGGVTPPVEHLAIAPRPDGGVALFGWVASLGLVMSRMWADDGNAFGDFEVFAPDGCDALSVGWAPGVGWVVVCASRSGSLAAGLREDAALAWGKRGVAVGSGSATATLAIAFDTGASWMLFERAAAVGGDRVLAFRYGAEDGAPRWARPVDLGLAHATSEPSGAVARWTAEAIREGTVRLDEGMPRQGALELASDGGLVREASRP